MMAKHNCSSVAQKPNLLTEIERNAKKNTRRNKQTRYLMFFIKKKKTNKIL